MTQTSPAQRSGFWIRTLAALIDLVILLPVFALCVVAAMQLTSDDERMGNLANGMFWSCWLVYSSMEIWTAGTAGKLLLSRRIVQSDGNPADLSRRCLRWSTKQFPIIFAVLFAVTGHPLFRLVSGFSFMVVSIGCLFASNEDHMTWHDQWAKTAVVRKPRPVAQGFEVVQ